ncbi:purine-nucleoside phosphorylase [Infirmifilum lucidum]|uniref:Purine-nucleoside phosphorylase n=1 Tax=Infirmifilum lucidum TaxID=2776706 RepID=A0A7L9FI00_9CREN|nr:purine-nucleoside phosphorylase [Infirmifilum lucidum]QOJ78546.1 purine-nucleoside phosphorylase [Infirmifilum lucidum]
MPFHIKAERVAPRVIAVGDPGRAKLLASMLVNPVLVNDNRGLLVYNGSWRGLEVTIATHGMGGPGAAIVFEELVQAGAKAIIRFGTTGGISREVAIGDFIVPTSAHYVHGGFFRQYFGDLNVSASPDLTLAWTLYSKGLQRGLKVHAGPVVSSDAFYAEDKSLAEKWASFGALSVEMECATLFSIAMLRRIKSAALLLVNGHLLEPEKRMVSEGELAEKLRLGGELVLDSLVSIKV